MSTQIRVPARTHAQLERMSKRSGAPITKIVARLVQKEINSARTSTSPQGAGNATGDNST